MFLYKFFKNVYFEDKGILTDFEIRNQPSKLFLLPKPTEHFPLMVHNSDDSLLFRSKDFFILLNDVSGMFGFIHFLGSFVQLFCLNCVIVNERIYQLLFYFFFVESLRLLNVFRTFPELKAKNNNYTTNLKHPLQTKNATPLSTKRVLLDMIKGCKSTIPQAFLQNCFSDFNLISKNNHKKLLLNYTKINIMA